MTRKEEQEPYEDFTQVAKQLSRWIGENLCTKTEEVHAAGRQQYEELLEMIRQIMERA